jgi:hypothetical protein
LTIRLPVDHPVSTVHQTGEVAMKRVVAGAVMMLAVALNVAGCGRHSQKDGWITLIDGNAGMENWSVSGSSAHWRAEDGAIENNKEFPSEG